MNSVLREILATQSVSDGAATLPLRHPDFPSLPVHMDESEGALLQDVVRLADAATTLEVGMAYGISTLFICEALAGLNHPARHIAIDPFQSSQWRGIGVRNVTRAGYGPLLEFHEERSELLLPGLVAAGRAVDVALIDGWHTFDQVMVEFYYINRLLNVGGVVAFDDAARASINRVVRYAINYDAYEVYGGQTFGTDVTWKGKVRRAIGGTSLGRQLLRRDLLAPDWELGIRSTCVALRKVKEDDGRGSGWYRDF